MAMLSSYTTLLSPALAPAPAKPSSAAALLLRSRQPAAELAVPLRWASCGTRSRAAIFARPCVGKNGDNKYTYDIEPNALVQSPTLAGEDWSIMGVGDKDLYVLKLRVGESTSKKKLHIETKADDQAVRLIIRYDKQGEADDDSKATKLNLDLKLPPGYDAKKQAQAWKFDEWLIVVVSKPKHNPNPVDVQ